MEFREYLKFMVVKDASDLYLTTDAPPTAKIQGIMPPLETTPMMPDRIREIANSHMDEHKQADFKKNPEMNLAVSAPGVGCFCLFFFLLCFLFGLVIRANKTKIPQL